MARVRQTFPEARWDRLVATKRAFESPAEEQLTVFKLYMGYTAEATSCFYGAGLPTESFDYWLMKWERVEFELHRIPIVQPRRPLRYCTPIEPWLLGSEDVGIMKIQVDEDKIDQDLQFKDIDLHGKSISLIYESE